MSQVIVDDVQTDELPQTTHGADAKGRALTRTLVVVEIEVVDRQRHRMQSAFAGQLDQLRRDRRLAGALQPGDRVHPAVVGEGVVEHLGNERRRIAGGAGAGAGRGNLWA